MSYGLYLYKEFPSKSGKIIRLEIFQDSFTGEALEIEELSATPLILEVDNANGELYTPIIKTNLMISIVNTNQIDYSIFFTPDATKFKVYIKIDSVTEWGGYLTPDSYSDAEVYRSEISLYARDNIGMLATMPFTTSFSIRSIQNILGDAFNNIGFLNTLEYRVKKLDNEEDSILSGVITTKAFAGKNWYEVVESLLRGIGCQMRFVGSAKYAIFDIADLAGYGDTLTTQPFLFIGKSGIKEILPAWRTIEVSQDFLLQESIYTGAIPAAEYVYLDTRNAGLLREFSYPPKPPEGTTEYYPEDFYLVPFGAYWTSSIPMLNPSTYGKNANTLLITGSTSAGLLGGTLDYSINLPQTTRKTNIVVRFNLKKTIQGVTRAGRTSPDRILKEIAISPSQKIHFRCNIFFETATSSQYLSSVGWFDKPTPYNESFDIIPPALDDNENMATAYQEVEFDLGFIDTEGRLSVVIYPYYLENELTLNPANYVLEIKDFDIVLTSNNELMGGVTTSTTINEKHNITGNIGLNIGQVPFYMGNQLTLTGGIFRNASYFPPMYNFHRPSDDNFRLYELIGREIAHHFKTQKNKLSGMIINSETFASMPSFGKVFTDGTINYLLNYGALDLRSEQMQVELIEVEPYVYEDYTFVEAEVSTGSGSLGSGSTEFIQWSSAGNAHRIYELDTASEAERAGAYVIIDKDGLSAGKKVLIGDLVTSSYSKLESDARYLKLTGGEVTGDLTLKNAKFNNTLLYSPDIEDDVLNLRRYGENHTILNILAPPQESWGKAKEATLALVRGDGNEYFLDLYNMDYGSVDAGNNLDYGSPIMGLRMQKRGTGVYTPFNFEYGDGTNVLNIMSLYPSTSSGSTNNSFVAITNKLAIGKTSADVQLDIIGSSKVSQYSQADRFALGAYSPYGYRFYQNDSSFAFGMYGENGIYKLQAAYQGTNSYTDFTRGFRVFNTTDNYEEFYTGKGRLELTRVMDYSSEFYSFDNGIKLDKAVLSFYQLSSTNGYARVLDIGAFGRTDSGYYGNNAESIIRFLYNTTGAYSGGAEAARFWRGTLQLGFTGTDYLAYKLAVSGDAYISGGTIIGGNFYGYGIGSFSGMVLGASFKSGNWKIIPVSTTQLQIQYNDVMMAKLDSAGNILATGGVTAYAV